MKVLIKSSDEMNYIVEIDGRTTRWSVYKGSYVCLMDNITHTVYSLRYMDVEVERFYGEDCEEDIIKTIKTKEIERRKFRVNNCY